MSDFMRMLHEQFDPFDSPDIKEPLDEEWATKRKLADAARRLLESLVTSAADVETLQRVASEMEQQAATLESGPRHCGRLAFEEAEEGRFGSHVTLGYELNPLDGKSNPLAPPIITWIDGDRAFARATLGWQYEGPPKSVHGGMVAALFDQFLGCAQRITKQPGFTGTLTVRYLQPTPLNVELRLNGWVERIEGRKNILKGEMWAGDTLTATCECTFVSVTPELYARFRSAHD